jgi:basic amino acid/polyamine antiporter, APA family
LKRQLSQLDAVFIGLAAMLGAGVFVVFGPAALLAGNWLQVAIVLAAIVAYLNAATIAQLASVVSKPGGAYAYGRHYLSDSWGFLAGAAFLVGKIGSAAAIALVFASYLTPGFEIITASLAIFVMAFINILGVNRTAFGSKVLAGITILFFLVLAVAAVFAPATTTPLAAPTGIGVLTAASLLFFAFAGYARVATLGDEVRDSQRAVPRAIIISLGIVFVIYLVLGWLVENRLGSLVLGSVTPLADLAAVSFGTGSFVFVFASIAALGSLLALLAGMSRTAASMADDGELPTALAIRNKTGAPWIAEWLIALIAILLAASGSFALTIGLSSFAVLTYYAIANLAGYRQPAVEAKRSKIWNILGVLMCLALAFSVPLEGLVLGMTALLLAMFLRWGLSKLR